MLGLTFQDIGSSWMCEVLMWIKRTIYCKVCKVTHYMSSKLCHTPFLSVSLLKSQYSTGSITNAGHAAILINLFSRSILVFHLLNMIWISCLTVSLQYLSNCNAYLMNVNKLYHSGFIRISPCYKRNCLSVEHLRTKINGPDTADSKNDHDHTCVS